MIKISHIHTVLHTLSDSPVSFALPPPLSLCAAALCLSTPVAKSPSFHPYGWYGTFDTVGKWKIRLWLYACLPLRFTVIALGRSFVSHYTPPAVTQFLPKTTTKKWLWDSVASDQRAGVDVICVAKDNGPLTFDPINGFLITRVKDWRRQHQHTNTHIDSTRSQNFTLCTVCSKRVCIEVETGTHASIGFGWNWTQILARITAAAAVCWWWNPLLSMLVAFSRTHTQSRCQLIYIHLSDSACKWHEGASMRGDVHVHTRKHALALVVAQASSERLNGI